MGLLRRRSTCVVGLEGGIAVLRAELEEFEHHRVLHRILDLDLELARQVDACQLDGLDALQDLDLHRGPAACLNPMLRAEAAQMKVRDADATSAPSSPTAKRTRAPATSPASKLTPDAKKVINDCLSKLYV